MNQTLNIALQSAKMDLIKSTNLIMQQYGLPACLLDGLLSSIQADIRAQATAELLKDFNTGGELTNE